MAIIYKYAIRMIFWIAFIAPALGRETKEYIMAFLHPDKLVHESGDLIFDIQVRGFNISSELQFLYVLKLTVIGRDPSGDVVHLDEVFASKDEFEALSRMGSMKDGETIEKGGIVRITRKGAKMHAVFSIKQGKDDHFPPREIDFSYPDAVKFSGDIEEKVRWMKKIFISPAKDTGEPPADMSRPRKSGH